MQHGHDKVVTVSVKLHKYKNFTKNITLSECFVF